MVATNNSIWYAISYMRLSKDDNVEKENGKTANQSNSDDAEANIGSQHISTKESNSITNQRKLIQNYITSSEDIQFVGEFYDDGYTGTNFERPGFVKLMQMLKDGKANCVIVKDLSRLGRDYIETGKYIEKIFPSMGVRFIAINDQVDSIRNNQADEIIIPFKNLINDSYCRELSNKLRNQFRIQRQNGEFIANFAFYGYKRSMEDKHKLVVDDAAAEIVKLIYAKKIEGYSCAKIAEYLNQYGVPSPCEYKKNAGSNYVCAFKERSISLWGAVTIKRILTNRIYLGYLEQGKQSSPNYKIKKMRAKEREEWIVVKNAHEAIISEETFEIVQRLLNRDTMTVSGNDAVYPLSGMFFCGDCHETMTRYKAKRKDKYFYYYICSGHKWKRGCMSNHSTEVFGLHEKVLNAIKLQISMVVEMEELLKEYGNQAIISVKVKRIDELIGQNRKELNRQQEFRMKLYENKVDGIISHEEYLSMKKKYSDKIDALQSVLDGLEQERASAAEGAGLNCSWMQRFIENKNVTELDRQLVVTLIDKIEIYEDKSIEITFNFKDEFRQMKEYLARAARDLDRREVVIDA